MGSLTRSIQQGIAIGKSPAAAMKGGVDESKITPIQYKDHVMEDSIDNADKSIDEMKSQKLELQDHHYPDAESGDTVSGKVSVDKDGTRYLDTTIGDSENARKDIQDSISSFGNMQMGGMGGD